MIHVNMHAVRKFCIDFTLYVSDEIKKAFCVKY